MLSLRSALESFLHLFDLYVSVKYFRIRFLSSSFREVPEFHMACHFPLPSLVIPFHLNACFSVDQRCFQQLLVAQVCLGCRDDF